MGHKIANNHTPTELILRHETITILTQTSRSRTNPNQNKNTHTEREREALVPSPARCVSLIHI